MTPDVGNLCVIFFAGKILDAGSTLLRMSLSVFFGNLHQLLNNLGSNSTIKFLKLQYCTCKQFHVWRYNRQNSAPVNEARFGLQSSIATCNNPLSNLQNELVSVRAWSSKTTRLKSRKLSTNRATPRKIEKLIVRASTKNSKNQTELLQPKTVNCNGFQQSTAVRKAIDWPATILVFDIETTGFSRQYERIIEIAIRDLIGGKDSTFETLINPKKPVSNTYVHGIQYDMVNRPDVPTFRELVPILLQYVRSRQMPGKPVILVAHNARQFDVPFITNEFQRCSMDIPEDWGFLDTLPLARQLVMPDGSKLPSVKLQSLGEHYGIPLVGPAHRAMPDVTLLCNVLQRITFDLKLTVSQLLDLALRPKRHSDVPP
ncbi:exonuclease DPD1, chloroplastic/mitochondrial-like isoform X1 [Zingiber officinale]|uniref:exonuclease DPD1, chloroplastic/mitochondrial-like isoform X1 n=2 Tax=Zingiber officinale TaxID=94328 RepID=UPI001C4D70A3|nr:exonuclease DPD1, chloroplastic/mitochondrial-like isoform X1 [Zingiber officinale]